MSEEKQFTGAEIVLQGLKDNGVEIIFGYPGGAVLPIYDVIFQQDHIKHILVRHEQGAGHAAEGYARSTGRPGVVLVTSGPGATNMVTPLQDALMDSIPLVCITGQVPSSLIGSDAFQEADTVGITLSCTKHNWLVKSVENLSSILHEAFYVATTGRPGPVLIDIPKDIQFATAPYSKPVLNRKHKSYHPTIFGDHNEIKKAVAMMKTAHKPIFYTGGGLINSGSEACELLRELVNAANFPITSTLMGLGAYPASDKNWIGMLGMHGTYEANMAMHDCDLMICIGARFDDRITGRLDAFSPHSKKIHIDIDPSSINKNVRIDVPIIGDAGHILKDMVKYWKSIKTNHTSNNLANWWKLIRQWQSRKCLSYDCQQDVIMPQYAIERLYELTKEHDVYITTEVGQHQMWAAQYYQFQKPARWITSGGLGTMGYGLPAAFGVQIAHPEALVIDIAGDASVLMTMQEISSAVQYKAPIKIFILNNMYMGMVRQWQQLLHGNRLSHSYAEAQPDFVKLADAYGCVGIRVKKPDELDEAIKQMIEIDEPVIFDCQVVNLANCFPMIPSGKAHNQMILPDEANKDVIANAIDKEGRKLV